MGDPHARAGAQGGLDRRDQAAGGMANLNRAIAAAFVDIGLAIGEHDHLLAGEVAHQRLLEMLRVPRAGRPVHLALGGDALDQLTHVSHDGQKLLAPRLPQDEAAQFLAETAPRQSGGDHRDQ